MRGVDHDAPNPPAYNIASPSTPISRIHATCIRHSPQHQDPRHTVREFLWDERERSGLIQHESKDMTPPALNFGQLVGAIRQEHDELAAHASRAVNTSLTLRNWMIGLHVEEYERRGVDRAEYGEKLMDVLADRLAKLGVSHCDRREIYRYRHFYLTYPQIVDSVTPQLRPLLDLRGIQWRSSGLQC